MYQQSNGRVRVEPTHAVYSNIASGKSAGRRKTIRAASAPRSKTPKGSFKISRPIKMITPRANVRKVSRSSGESKMSMATAARMEAAKTVMGQFFPSVYRNVTASGETTNAPVTSITVTDRYIGSSTNGHFIVDASFTMAEHVRISTAFTGPNVSSEDVLDSQSYTSMVANSLYYRCAGMEIVVEPNAASSVIQGEWAAYCFQGVNTIVGLNTSNIMSHPQAARGFLTDAKPSFRYVWFKRDERDDDWNGVGYLPGNGETSVRVAVDSLVDAVYVVYITTTWTIQPNTAGSYVIPGQPVIVDQAAYQRGLKVFGDAVNENVEIVTNPRVANQKHPGILAQVAEAVSDTVGEASLLKKALGGAWNLGKSLVGAVSSLFSASKENAALVTTMVTPAWVKKLDAELTDNKDDSVPEEVMRALRILASYKVHRGRRGELMQFERVDDSASTLTVVLPSSKTVTKSTR